MTSSLKYITATNLLAFLPLYFSAALLPLSPATLGASLSSPLWTYLSCHFAHASFLHFLLNAYAYLVLSLSFRPRLVLLAFASAFLATPLSLSALPTVGLSGVIYALCGIAFAASPRQVLPYLIPLMAVNLLPSISLRMHVFSFLWAFAIYSAFYKHSFHHDRHQ